MSDVPPPPPPTPVQHDGGYVVLDTETGGFHPLANPLLSVAAVFLDPAMAVVGSYYYKVSPPEGTLIEVPARHLIGTKNPARKAVGYLDLYSWEPVEAADGDTPVVGSFAGELTGLLTVEDGKYVQSATQEWLGQAAPALNVDEALVAAATAHYSRPADAVAHNAAFDKKFVERHLPRLAGVLNPAWICTMRRLQQYKKEVLKDSSRGGTKLTDLAKYAGYDLANAHDALADTVGCVMGLRWLASQGVEG